MRRSRKPRVVWLPPDPFNSLGTDPNTAIANVNASSIRHIEIHLLGPAGTGTSFGAAVPIVGDGGNAENTIIGLPSPSGPQYAVQTLSDMFNSGYRLRRICGHIFARMPQRPVGQGGVAGDVFLTASFQVMRVDSNGNPVDVEAANPTTYVNQDNPWIWRRTWCLSNFANPFIIQGGAVSNLGLSVREGTFIDQKTARVVGPDERLFLCLSATMTSGNDATLDDFIVVDLDIRVLASLKTNLGNRRNASR